MIYYLETNIIAIIVAAILLRHNSITSSKNETSHLVFNVMLGTLIITSIADIFAYYFRGRNGIGIEVFNILYFIGMALGCYSWFFYSAIRLGNVQSIRKLIIYSGIPVAVLTTAVIFNPITHWFFTVDENLYYQRGIGVIFVWIVEWAYVLLAFFTSVKAYIEEKRPHFKKEIRGYLFFLLPPVIAAVVQMAFYGTTVLQIGFMVSLLLTYLNKQHFQVNTDALTGLNNKSAFETYRDSLVYRPREDITLFMIDCDKFKHINDTYGHIKGDQALKDIAAILIEACSVTFKSKAETYRYGGDEFVVIGTDVTDEEKKDFRKKVLALASTANERNKQKGERYILSLSVGNATKSCLDVVDFDKLLEEADEAMYNNKKARGQVYER